MAENVPAQAAPGAPVSPAPTTPAAPAAKKRKKTGGCLRGCLLLLVVLILLLSLALVWLLRIPQKMGWIKSASAEMVERAPERLTAEEIVLEAKDKGFKTAGVDVYVFPRPGTDEVSLLAVYDFSQKRIELSRASEHQPVIDTMLLLGGGKKAEEHKVTYVGLEFHDEKGNFLLSASAKTEDVRALRDGKLAEEEFRKRMGIRADAQNYFKRSLIRF